MDQLSGGDPAMGFELVAASIRADASDLKTFLDVLAVKLEQLMINSSSCAAGFTQMAAIEALSMPESEHAVHRMVKVFEHRRDLVVDGLNAIPGVRCKLPQGAFYAFPNITQTGQTSADLQAKLMADAGVAALSGTAFGPYGEGFLRFSYANSVENIRLALEAIRAQLT